MPIWNTLTYYVDKVNTVFISFGTYCITNIRKQIPDSTVDKITVAVAVTRFWAKVALLINRIINYLLQYVLYSPECFFPRNEPIFIPSDAHGIKIHHASTESQIITRRFRWWLNRCLTTERPLNNISVDFKKFSKIFGAQVLYCCYSVLEKNNKYNTGDLKYLFIKTLQKQIGKFHATLKHSCYEQTLQPEFDEYTLTSAETQDKLQSDILSSLHEMCGNI